MYISVCVFIYHIPFQSISFPCYRPMSMVENSFTAWQILRAPLYALAAHPGGPASGRHQAQFIRGDSAGPGQAEDARRKP